MQFTYSHHAERRLNERNLTKGQVQAEFWAGEGQKVHGGLTQKDLILDGLEVRVVARRIHKGWHIVTVHFLDD